VIEAPPRVTLEEERWFDESERLLAALSHAEPRILASQDRHELHRLCEFYRKVAKEARGLTAPTARAEDARRPLELACIAFARAADQKTRNFTGIWPKALAEGTAFLEQARNGLSGLAA